jgi:hypothetical protein
MTLVGGRLDTLFVRFVVERQEILASGHHNE